MIRIDKILFPTDFSEAANEALRYALYLADKYDATLHMLHAVVLHEEDPYNPAQHFPDVEAAYEAMRRQATDLLDAATADHAVENLKIKRVERREVSAAAAVLEYAKEQDVDLIVMGTHGRRGVRQLLLGSVAEEVVRKAPCAVLTIRSRVKDVTAVNRILSPIDFSKASKGALAVARHVAEIYDAELALLHVLENAIHPAFYQLGAQSIADLQPGIFDRAEAALHDAMKEAGGPDVRATYHALEGHAARAVLRFAEEQDVDLIVIATHGLSAIEHFLLGGVTEKVIRRAPCPVLVTRPYGKSLVVNEA